MRLAVISPFVDRQHGTERSLAELLERLAHDYGCEIHLYAQRVADLRLRGEHPSPAMESGSIIWHRVPSIPGPHLLQFLAWILLNTLIRKKDIALGRKSIDLVLSPGINCLRPDVVIVHVVFHRLRELSKQDSKEAPRTGHLRRTHRRLYYQFLTALERRIYSDPRVTIGAVSRRTSELVSRLFHRDDVGLVPYGVDTSMFSLSARLAAREIARRTRGIPDRDCVLLLIGNDWKVKGLRTVFEAMAAARDKHLRLLIVGTDNALPYQNAARELGILENCLWETTNPDVLSFYAAADIYVCPSQEDSFGLPVAEAMACGLPVITSAFAGAASAILDGVDGFVLEDPNDSLRLAKIIQELSGAPELRKRVGEAAAIKIASWTWDRHAAAAWKLLTAALARRSASSHPSGQ